MLHIVPTDSTHCSQYFTQSLQESVSTAGFLAKAELTRNMPIVDIRMLHWEHRGVFKNGRWAHPGRQMLKFHAADLIETYADHVWASDFQLERLTIVETFARTKRPGGLGTANGSCQLLPSISLFFCSRCERAGNASRDTRLRWRYRSGRDRYLVHKHSGQVWQSRRQEQHCLPSSNLGNRKDRPNLPSSLLHILAERYAEYATRNFSRSSQGTHHTPPLTDAIDMMLDKCHRSTPARQQREGMSRAVSK